MYTAYLLLLSLAILGAKGQDYQDDITPDINQETFTEDEDMLSAPQEDETPDLGEDELMNEDVSNEEYDDQAATEGCKTKLPGSCQELFKEKPKTKSGMHILHVNGKNIRVYCHMGVRCGSKGGWTRLAYLNMKKQGQKCPNGFHTHKVGNVRACGRFPKNDYSCQPVIFPSKGVPYSQVCGCVTGYQFATTDAVEPGLWKNPQKYVGGTDPKHNDINRAYVDGVSITRGCPRKHVWTLMAGLQDSYTITNGGRFQCPCNKISTQKVQGFIGTDYFCESGNPHKGTPRHLFPNDPLWDGKQCGRYEKKCCNAKGLPWFNKKIGYITSDYLELRVCADQETKDEDSPVGFYEIYVK